MTSHRPVSMFRITLRLVATSLALVATACATSQVTLEGVLVGDQRASGEAIRLVQIVRGGDVKTTRIGMSLKQDDRITTAPGTSAVIVFKDAWEVILLPETELVIIDPDPTIFQRLGETIVTKLKELRERFQAETDFVVLTPEGTQFRIRVEGERATFQVVEGRLRVDSRTGAWPTAVYEAMEQGTAVGAAAPHKTPLDPREAEEIRRDVERIRGELFVFVPALVGRQLAEARMILQQEGLVLGDVESQITGRASVDTVLQQRPRQGDRVRAGDRVELVVEARSVRVPDVTRANVQTVRRILEAAGLRVGRVTEELGRRGVEGAIIRQSPRAGALVAPGTRVDVVVFVAGVVIPDLRGWEYERAMERLQAMGLRPNESAVYDADRYPNCEYHTVCDQSPAPRTIVRQGSRISLYYRDVIVE